MSRSTHEKFSFDDSVSLRRYSSTSRRFSIDRVAHNGHPYKLLIRDGPLRNGDFVLKDALRSEEIIQLMHFTMILMSGRTGYRIASISKPFLDLLDRSLEDVLCHPWNAFVDDECENDVAEEIAEALKSGKPITRSIQFKSKTSTMPQRSFCFFPFHDLGNLAEYAFVIAADDISNVERLLSGSILTSHNGMDSIIEYVTQGLCKLTGFERKEITNVTWTEFCKGCEVSYPQSSTQNERSDFVSIDSRLLYQKDGQAFWASIFSFPIVSYSDSYRSYRHLRIVIDVTSTDEERIENYVLGRAIGNGASGTVRIARSIRTDEIVAIKILDAKKFRSISEIEFVQDEIRALSAVKHENIINLREVIFEGHTFYFVMDFAAGGSLATYLRSVKPTGLDEEESRKILHQIVSAVAYCHRRRLIHRDLKPENILMDGNGRILVADFGLSAMAAPCSGLSNLCGTPEFLAPEVISSTEYDGATADIWSLGILLHELVTGTTPFKGPSQSELFKAIQSKELDPLPDHLSLACRDLMTRMLIKNPPQRITMDEILYHSWWKHNLASMESSFDQDPKQNQKPSESNSVHKSALLTIGDWASEDDAISNAIVSGDYSRSPSVVIVRNSASESTQKLESDLEKLRAICQSEENASKSKSSTESQRRRLFKKRENQRST